jgi:hypothetical protein
MQGMSRAGVVAGASGLGKRQRKEFEDSMLGQLKAKVQKPSRIPASVGLGNQFLPI